MPLEKITTQQMDAKGVCAAPDILNGTPAQNKSIFDRMVRELIAPAYNAAVDAIAAIEQTETGIEAAEDLRVAAENLRASAETAREQAESGRVTAEEARAAAESLRASAEELRASAEQARAAAEQERASAEQGRSTAEQSRDIAEKARASAETGRASAETARDTAEQAREAAEKARADETSGIVARATEQADLASSAATSAGNSAMEADASESAAASSASSAAGSAAAASTSETNAKASETAAKASENAAKASETAAKESETTAKSEADRAKSEADRAAGIVGGDYATKTDLSAHTDDADIHVTAEEKTAWSGKQEAVERIQAKLSYSKWDSEYKYQDISNSKFLTSGYIYLVTCKDTDDPEYYDVYLDFGIYASRVYEEGIMTFYARKIPEKTLTVTITKIAAPGAYGEVYNAGSFWLDKDELKEKLKPAHVALIGSSQTIPAGRMVGDVDGDGEITISDKSLIMKATGGSVTLTDIQRQCADVNADGSISSQDALITEMMAKESKKIGQYSSDVLGNWTVNPNYATEDAQFYTDIPVSGMAAGQDISIIIGGGKESSKIVKVEAIDGAMRVWATSLPIEALPYKFVQDGPKTVSVTLAAASWDSTAKTQTVTVTGVKASETAQMITPTPALASQTAYYEAGILCTGQAADSLTFTCKTVPTADLTVYVVMEELVSG